jgi:phosphoenolpyruvate carboxykinase (ATP)
MNSFYQNLGLKPASAQHPIHFNMAPHQLIQKTLEKKQGTLTKHGALVVKTGEHTGRSAQDRYVVKSATTENKIWWENAIRPMTSEQFNHLKGAVLDFINQGEEVFISERSVGADQKHHIGVRLISSFPSHVLFSNHLFRDPEGELNDNAFTVLHAPTLKIDPEKFGTRAQTVITTDFDQRITLVIGSLYAGEIKKSMFSVMNYLLPDAGVLPMHAGANRLSNGETGVFFGLSGTGKTTLSTDIGTYLIGDDEHGLSDGGLFNFEGGCYAKTYKLSAETEPEIFKASQTFGAMLENVMLDEKSGEVDYNDKSLTENGRLSYPLSFIEELEATSRGNLPKNMFFLTADAFGVLPPVAKLTRDQAMFYFMLGYTAKLAGTEIGIKEPQAAFSTCFGAPFMLRHPGVYADLLGKHLDKHPIDVWLINTGWTGGPYGEGERFPLKITRQIIRSIQKGDLAQIPTEQDPVFGLHLPLEVKGVESTYLKPQMTWKKPENYLPQAQKLALSFHEQIKKFGEAANILSKGAPTYKG